MAVGVLNLGLNFARRRRRHRLLTIGVMMMLHFGNLLLRVMTMSGLLQWDMSHLAMRAICDHLAIAHCGRVLRGVTIVRVVVAGVMVGVHSHQVARPCSLDRLHHLVLLVEVVVVLLVVAVLAVAWACRVVAYWCLRLSLLLA